MNRLRLTTKLSLISGGCAIVGLIGALVLLARDVANERADDQLFQRIVQQQDLARVMQLDFKKQVQEWKDTLLRGHEAADFDKYHHQFLDQENRVRADAKELLANSRQPATHRLVEDFLSAHEQMGRSYRDALALFVQSGRTDYRIADQHVRGIDRPPTDLIDKIVQGIDQEQVDQLAWRHASRRRERWLTVAASTLISAVLIGGAFWMARRILAPIAALTETMTKVSAGKNYALRAQPAVGHEMARLTEVFNEMLTMIEGQNTALQAGRAELERQLRDLTDSQAKVADSLSVLHATLESTTDGLLVVDLNDRVTAVNRKFADMWRLPPELLATNDDRKLLTAAISQLKNPAEFLDKVRHLYADREASSFDVLVFSDGRIFERYSQPQRVNGVTVGRVWSFRDITARERTQAELERLNKQLVQTARQAGMAEVATGVLHNVGNVLNSVNVASSSVADTLKRSKSVNLSKIVALMREQETDLGNFLLRDPKGKQILPYLQQLGEHLVQEHATVLEELAQLQKSVEHIREIVTRQQSLSKVSTASESVAPASLFQDALKINQSSVDRHGVEIVREFAPGAAITTDPNQVIQILVNLIRNAIQACEACSGEKKQVVLRVGYEANRVRLVVADNGIGIARENLDRVFTHGFTTKKDGHGFGLHSCAVMAGELQGSLTVQSDGPGTGATFTLELPIG